MNKFRIMLIDDHNVVRAGLKALIDRQEDMEVVTDSDSIDDAVRVVEQTRPDVLLLDLTVRGGSSVGLISELQQQPHCPRILVLSMHDDPAYARAVLAAGAVGYVVKTIGEQELLTAIRTVRRGQVLVDLGDEVRTAAVFRDMPPKRGAPATHLTAREQEVLLLLGKGHSNLAIAEQLDISPKTVATHRARITQKLGMTTIADFVRYATDTGLTGARRGMS